MRLDAPREEALFSPGNGAYFTYTPPPIIIAEMGYAYAAWGKKDEARKIIQKLNEIGKQTYVDPYLIAGIYSALYAAHTKIPTPG